MSIFLNTGGSRHGMAFPVCMMQGNPSAAARSRTTSWRQIGLEDCGTLIHHDLWDKKPHCSNKPLGKEYLKFSQKGNTALRQPIREKAGCESIFSGLLIYSPCMEPVRVR